MPRENRIKVRYDKGILVKFWLDFELFYFIVATVVVFLLCRLI
jgi:hypothetical protein